MDLVAPVFSQAAMAGALFCLPRRRSGQERERMRKNEVRVSGEEAGCRFCFPETKARP